MMPPITPRLLPVTIAAMALLLAVKSVVLVRAATAGAELGIAHAAEVPALSSAPAAAAPVTPVVPAANAAPAPPSEPPMSEKERALLLDLRGRDAQLDARAAALSQREGVLAAAEARLTARLDELTSLQQRLESLDAVRKQHDEANWQGLVKLYQAMKPRDAAAIFNDLDLPVVLPTLDRMKDRSAAAILAAMQPERARLLTAELARLRTQANAVPAPQAAAATMPAKPGG